jgi:hypothetical protein
MRARYDEAEPGIPPDEALEAAYGRLRSADEGELLDTTKAVVPAFFEQLVIDLLVRMGYGGSGEGAARAVGQSGDGGVRFSASNALSLAPWRDRAKAAVPLVAFPRAEPPVVVVVVERGRPCQNAVPVGARQPIPIRRDMHRQERVGLRDSRLHSEPTWPIPFELPNPWISTRKRGRCSGGGFPRLPEYSNEIG